MSKIKMNKRGVAIIFNWIFSLVAGVLIFSFLIFFAVQNTDLFGKVTARVVAEELDILFSGYETIQTESVLDFDKNVKLNFKCAGVAQKFEINGKAGKTVWDKIIFAPDEVEGEKINVATMSWKVPFRVANFIYLFDKRYHINERYETGIKLVDDLKGTGQEIIIDRFNRDLGCPGDSKSKTIYYDDTEEGYVCFNGGGDEPVNFFGEAMLVGAIISDKDNFICAQNLAEKKLQIMKKTFENKNKNLYKNLFASKAFCNKVIYREIVNGIPLGVKSLDDSKIRFLKNRNDELIKEGCASVY